MLKVTALSVPKDLNFANQNEDVFKISDDQSLIVLSDGASESFNSQVWADLLTSHFIKNYLNTRTSPMQWLDYIIADYNQQHDVESLSWSQQNAFARGSFATLAGIHFIESQTVELFCVGDSLVVLLDEIEPYIHLKCYGFSRLLKRQNKDNNIQLKQIFMYQKSESFKDAPQLFSSRTELNKIFDDKILLQYNQTCWDLAEYHKPIIFLMTDALAQWALKNAEVGKPKWSILNHLNSNAQLVKLVIQEREKKRLKTDDTTLIKIEVIR